MAVKYRLPRGTKARLEQIKLDLLENTIVYATDTGEIGIKRSDGNIEYFMNADDIDAELNDRYTKAQTYNKAEVDNLIEDIEDGTIVAGKALKDELGNEFTRDYTKYVEGFYSFGDNKIYLSSTSHEGTVYEEEIDLPLATDTKDGLLSKEDKEYIDGLPTGLAGKVSKVTTAGIAAYTKNGPTQSTMNIAVAPTASTLVQRDTDGRIRASAGIDNNHVVNVEQLNNALGDIDAVLDAILGV